MSNRRTVAMVVNDNAGTLAPCGALVGTPSAGMGHRSIPPILFAAIGQVVDQ
jgi:hypothetical protein